MAQIAVTDKQVEDWEPKLNSIVEWFGQLQNVDVTGVPPAIHSNEEGNVLRSDAQVVYDRRPDLLSQAPALEGTYVRVPKMKETAVASSSSSSASSVSSSASSVDESAAASTAGPAGTSPVSPNLDALQALDIRVGKIISCERHPDAESLYVEKIDVGEAEPRTIVSGLVKYVPIEEMQNRSVLVICNLKPRNMRGIKSFGMVLAASDEPHVVVEPLLPPPGAAAGERVWFGEVKEQAAAAEAKVVDKKKLWEVIQPHLKTDDKGAARYLDMTMNTSAGPVKSVTLAGARIA